MSKKILVVDDDLDFQFLISKKLRSQGFECDCVDSVEKALLKLKEDTPGLVILDLRFAHADGTAFLKNAHHWISPGASLPPILVLSGFDEAETVRYVLELGARDFIKKPFDTEVFLSKVRQYLQIPALA